MVSYSVRGLVRGRELAGLVAVVVDGGAVRLDHADSGTALVAVPFAAIEGIRHDAGQVVLYLAGGDVLELTGERGLGALARDLLSHLCTLPELTRALRSLGSARTPSRAEHDRFFAPLLGARRQAESARDPLAQVAAFDAGVIRARLGELARALAAERYAEHPPARRALEAELDECLEPFLASLARLADSAAGVAAESDESRLVAWRQWAAQLREVFVCADRCWAATDALLRRAPYERDGWWQRLRRSAGR